jgi:hypothetical protein
VPGHEIEAEAGHNLEVSSLGAWGVLDSPDSDRRKALGVLEDTVKIVLDNESTHKALEFGQGHDSPAVGDTW